MNRGAPWAILDLDGPVTVCRYEGAWRLLCGCGDIIEFENVVHSHCANCHVTCGPQEDAGS